jgi:hypothetical protein
MVALRAMVMYGGVPLNNVMYDCMPKEDGSFDASAWLTVKPELTTVNSLVNLPCVVDGEMVVSQTNANLAYLGRQLGSGETHLRKFVPASSFCVS